MNVNGLFPRGSTFHKGTTETLTTSYGQSVALEGHIAYFKDETVSSAGVRSKRSDRVCKCMLVRNVSGVTLLPKMMVRWAAGYVGRRIEGYTDIDSTGTGQGRVAGVVDELLSSAGVPNYDLFWLQVSGPCLVKTGIANASAIIEGQQLIAVTATDGAVSTTAGRAVPLVVAADTTGAATIAIYQQLAAFARAISTHGTESSGTDLLVDLNCMNI